MAQKKASEAKKGFVLTRRQNEANALLASDATHILLYGGARSGKTFLFCRAMSIRAMREPGSRHAILRYRFNHVKASIWHDTWPKMMKLCWPNVKLKQDKQDYFIQFPNESQVWFGGLDEKERTEKILGQEYATIFLNECSQIGFAAREIVLTRLAQKTGLNLKMYYDENPPMITHWTHRLFIEKRDPEPPYAMLENPDDYAVMSMNPKDNAENLPEQTLKELQGLSPRKRLRFWEGKFGDESENALWSYDVIERNRKHEHPDFQRVIVAVDPSGTKGEEDQRSDHVGVVVVGLGVDGHGYVVEDLTIRAGPAVWGRIVATTYDRHNADCVVGEINFGGAMVEHTVRTAAHEQGIRVVYKEVRASRGKVVRAEPVAALYEQNKIHHVGYFSELEDQLQAFTTAGYTGDRSPDRADALIWGLMEIFPGMTRKMKQELAVIESAGGFSAHTW